PVPDMQAWMEAHMSRMRASNDEMVGNFHRRSLLVEPKQDANSTARAADGRRSDTGSDEDKDRPKTASRDRLETILKGGSFSLKAIGPQEVAPARADVDEQP
ncbi:Ras guanine nucleotide exchange factor bud5, partial [Teratosphaeriaceae sp. CCFEE 6253]